MGILDNICEERSAGLNWFNPGIVAVINENNKMWLILEKKEKELNTNASLNVVKFDHIFRY